MTADHFLWMSWWQFYGGGIALMVSGWLCWLLARFLDRGRPIPLSMRVGALLMMVGSMLYLELPYPLSLIGAAILGAGVCLIIRGPDDWWWRRKRQLMATVLKVRTVLAWGVSARRPVPA